MDIEALSSTIAEAVAEAWGTLFMKEVSITSGIIDDTEGFIAAPGSYVTCELDFEGDAPGQAKWFIPKTEALTMVGMMMAMGTDDELVKSTREGEMGEDELDAIKEAFNQLCSTSATVIRDNKELDISGSIREPKETEVELELSGGEHVIPLTLELYVF
jgi:chemotaxis protein CheY-P-specific phosphatase CheC